MKKSIKIILIAIVVIILLIIGIISYAYFATDMFKSNKQLFFEYALHLVGDNNSFVDEELIQYIEKKQSNAFTDEGKIYVNYNTTGDNADDIKILNQMSVTFRGQINKSLEENLQNISVNYSDTVKEDVLYKQIGNIFAIQSNDMSAKYLGIDISKFGNDDSSLEDVQETLEKAKKVTKMSKEEQQTLKRFYNKCIEVVNKELPEESFTKIANENETGYKLTVNTEKLNSIYVKILEAIENDTEILNLLNLTNNDVQGYISELSANIKSTDENSGLITSTRRIVEDIELTIYQKGNKISKVEFVQDLAKISVQKVNNNGKLQYNIILNSDNDLQFILDITYTGLSTLQNVNEDYKFTLKGSIDGKDNICEYYFNNDVKFDSVSSLASFSDDTLMNLSELPKEQAEAMMNAITERIELINKIKLEEMRVNDTVNPFESLVNVPVGIVMDILYQDNLIYQRAKEAGKTTEFATARERLEVAYNAGYANNAADIHVEKKDSNLQGAISEKINAVLKEYKEKNKLDSSKIKITQNVGDNESLTELIWNEGTAKITLTYTEDGSYQVGTIKVVKDALNRETCTINWEEIVLNNSNTLQGIE